VVLSGTSYEATAALFTAALKHPAVVGCLAQYPFWCAVYSWLQWLLPCHHDIPILSLLRSVVGLLLGLDACGAHWLLRLLPCHT
jgi:hypothetical protein